MRKIVIILCALLMVMGIATTASAAKSASISLSANDTSVGGGDKVTITVKATVDQCDNGGMEVSLDTKRFELISGDWLLNGILTDFDEKSKDGVFALDTTKKLSGKVFQLVIKVKKDAPLGNGSVTFKFKADEKTVSKSISIKVTCSHKYSNSCDTSCNLCGATRKITHSWNQGDVIKAATCTGTGSAKFTCTVCKETKTDKLDKTSHTYDHGCDTDCNVCGATREIVHVLGWACDSAEHWLACSVCGYQQDRGAHTLDSTLTGTADGHGNLCTVCNLIPDVQKHSFDSACDADCADCDYQRNVKHYYGATWHYDAQGHWKTCILCGNKTALEAHTTDVQATTDPVVNDPAAPQTPAPANSGDEDVLCTLCGYVVTPAVNHVHVKAGDWVSDDAGHRYPCLCGGESTAEPHNWDTGAVDEAAGVVVFRCVDCGHARAEVYIPAPTNWFEELTAKIPLWMILSAGLALSVVVNLVLVISMIAASHRRAKNARFMKQAETVEQ